MNFYLCKILFLFEKRFSASYASISTIPFRSSFEHFKYNFIQCKIWIQLHLKRTLWNSLNIELQRHGLQILRIAKVRKTQATRSSQFESYRTRQKNFIKEFRVWMNGTIFNDFTKSLIRTINNSFQLTFRKLRTLNSNRLILD